MNPLDRTLSRPIIGNLPHGAGQGPIPSFRIGNRAGGSAVDSRAVNSVASNSSEQLATLAAENAPIRIPYGRVMLGAQLADMLVYSFASLNYLVIIAVWGQGPIDAYEQFFIDGAAPSSNVLVTHYTGSQTVADPDLVAAFAAQVPAIVYADVLPGIAYSVVRIPVTQVNGQPELTAVLRGLKVYDWRVAQNLLIGSSGFPPASTPDSAANSITGDIDVRVEVRPESYITNQVFLDKWSSSGQASYRLQILSGFLFLVVSADGSSQIVAQSTVAVQSLGVADRQKWWLRAICDVDNGASGRTFRFYISLDGSAWTQLGADVIQAGVISIFNGTRPLLVGCFFDGTLPTVGRIFRAQVLNGIGGSVVVDFNPSIAALGVGSFVAATGETWTVNAPSAIAKFIEWSDCPALCQADLITSPVYGAALNIDWASVGDTANTNDELVSSEKRRTFGLVLDQMSDFKVWMEALRGYSGCFVVPGDPIRLVPDRPAAVAFTFSESAGATPPANTSLGRLSNLRKSHRENVPTVVAVKYTDTTQTPWRDDIAYAYAAGVTEGSALWRPLEIAFPGIQRYSQAKREAIEQLNKRTLNDLAWTIDAPDEALAVQVGDVVATTAYIGLTAKQARVIGGGMKAPGRFVFQLEEYDPAAYSDNIVSGPTRPDTSLPSPSVVQAPTGLALTEAFYLENVTATGNTGLIYQSRLEVSWTKTSHYYPVEYRIRVIDGTKVIHEGSTTSLTYATPAIQQGKNYTVQVTAVNSLLFESAPVQASLTALGKGLPPTDVPSILTAFELGGVVELTWQPSIDIDAIRYEWRYGAVGGFSWASATLIDRVDGLRASFSGLPTGTWRFAVKAIDSLGQYSTNAKTVDITVTTDQDAFIQSHEFTNPFISGTELVTNGNMSSGVGWDVIGAGWTINNAGNGKAVATAAAGGVAIAQGGKLVVGRWYKCEFDIDSISSGGLTAAFGGGASSAVVNTAGHKILYGQCAGDGTLGLVTTATTTCQVDNLSYIEVSNLREIPMLEGVWKKRWATNVVPDVFNSATAFNGAGAVFDEHTNATSFFRGEVWDVGVAITADWSIVADILVVDGAVAYYLETSADNVTFTRQAAGITWKGNARFVRPVIEGLASSTFQVNAPPLVKLAALTRSESGQITTAASGGTLVQLSGRYIAVQDLQLTPINTTASRNGVVDRILIHPETGLLHQFDFSGPAGSDAAAWQTISSAGGRVIASGDHIEFDVYLDARSGPAINFSNGGLCFFFTDTADSGAMVDTVDGHLLYAPAITFDPLIRGVWRSVKGSLAAFVGKTVATIRLTQNSEGSSGTNCKVLYRNMRITDGAGTTRLTIYSSGEPSSNIAGTAVLVSNVQCGPSNSFLAYTFTSNTAAQVASDSRWSFSGY